LAENTRLFLSCEHGGNRVPEAYRTLFLGHEKLLATHRGYDIGALPLARSLALALEAPLLVSEITRLLVDLNRSLSSPTLFSEITRDLAESEQKKILKDHYHPYREAVEQEVETLLDGGGRVIHLSIHSFTPFFEDQVRSADLGLLYDPGRVLERELCRGLQADLREGAPSLRVRRNYPYRGISDSVVTALRRRLEEEKYLGIEIEVNQKHPQGDPSSWEFFQQTLVKSLKTLTPFPSSPEVPSHP
jgi:predicted N-formylglutamate amidohydrolase